MTTEPGPSAAGEIIGSFALFGGMWALLLNAWGAYGFLTDSTPQTKHIVTYWVIALLMVAAIVWTFFSAQRREARVVAYVWHVLVAGLAITAICGTLVPRVEWRSLNDPPPVEKHVDYNPCYSGGDPCG